MGFFDLIILNPGGRPRAARAANALVWRAHGRLLRRMLPARAGGPFSYQIGFAGPQYPFPEENPTPVPDADVGIDRWLSLADIESEPANEGGVANQTLRDLVGYDRQDVSWTFSEPAGWLVMDTGWHEFSNRVGWQRYGDWAPHTWRDAVDGEYPQPSPWYDCRPIEGGHGYPWCTARVNQYWWQNVPPPYHCVIYDGLHEHGIVTEHNEADCATAGGNWKQAQHPDNRNPWSIVAEYAPGIRELGELSVGCVFVTISGGGYSDELLAAARLRDPFRLRPGGTMSVRYRGAWG